MHYIIFAAVEPIELGQQTLSMSDRNADVRRMPCLVVREATREEWIADHPEIVGAELVFQLQGVTHFYAVHVD